MMVQVKNSSNVVVVTYGRDALHRHVTDTVGSSVTDRLFSEATQLLETKAGSNTVTRNVWSPAYVDAMVLRDRDTDSNGTLDERIYPLQDANWNTTGLVNTSGTVVERETYGPYGGVTFRDGYGSVISTSARDWVFLHQGGEKIAAGDYEFRNRVYSPTLGRWLSNDPIGINAGDVNAYRYVGNDPTNKNDPTGLFPGATPVFVRPAPRPIPGGGPRGGQRNGTDPVEPTPIKGVVPATPLPFWDPSWGPRQNIFYPIEPGPIIYGPPNPSGYLIDPRKCGAPTFYPGKDPNKRSSEPIRVIPNRDDCEVIREADRKRCYDEAKKMKEKQWPPSEIGRWIFGCLQNADDRRIACRKGAKLPRRVEPY